MARPILPRRVGCRYRGRGFKPMGTPMHQLPRVTLGLDELEALRLADLEGLYQEAAAERMGVSRPTFARILARGHATVADALVGRKALLVGPAEVIEAHEEPSACPIHWGGRRRGRGCRCGGRRWDETERGAETTDAGSEEPKGGSNAEV
jgi:predicted DNA-binding protein (UPF0251 family)